MRRVGHRYGGHQFAGIRMLRVFKHGATWANLNDAPTIHHRYAVADAFNHRHIVRNKQEGDAHFAL